MLEGDGDAWRYGFSLAADLRLKSGTMYPLLARLEAAGWLESRWEDGDAADLGRPRRRLYRLTETGAEAATRALDEVQR